MAKRSRDSVLTSPLPSTRGPWGVILLFIAGIVLVHQGFLQPKDKLLGPPVPDPSYLQQMKAPVKASPVIPPPVAPVVEQPALTPTTPPAATPRRTPAPHTAAPATRRRTDPAATAPRPRATTRPSTTGTRTTD